MSFDRSWPMPLDLGRSERYDTTIAPRTPPADRAKPHLAGGEEICFLSAQELLRCYRSRALSPVEVVTATLDRITTVNAIVNALHYVDADGALGAARAAEARWQRREPAGLLDGVPVTIKDSVYVAGMPTHHGSRAFADLRVPTRDSPATARLREHGAVIVGKTTMPDLGMIAAGVSSLYGVTRNPWNIACNSGGSSSGAGAAVAAGLCALAVGSDIGGSIRIPASFCGIVGLKPSYGRVPVIEPWQGLVAGPMARTIADAALMLNVLSGADEIDYTALPFESRDYLDGLGTDVRGLRMGLLTDIGFGLSVHSEVRARIEAAAQTLASAGAIVLPMPPIFSDDPEPHFDRMLQAYAWSDFSGMTSEQQQAILPHVREWCRRGKAMSASDFVDATIGIAATRRRVLQACASYDYVLAPTMAMPPYAAELPWPPGGTQHNPFCFPFNLSEQPALSVCCGFTRAGLPVGLQIIGKRFDDAGVLRVGRAYEIARAALPYTPIGLA
jgi:aspartyl-tRNA(Asn)/glutamyl-tRNA(Gln) amidotransferase subunit A